MSRKTPKNQQNNESGSHGMYGTAADDERLLEHHRVCLAATGFSIHFALHEGYPITYTIGCEEKLGYELVVTGLHPHFVQTFLPAAASYISHYKKQQGSIPENVVILTGGYAPAAFSIEAIPDIHPVEFDYIFKTTILLGRKPTAIRHMVALVPSHLVEQEHPGIKTPDVILHMAKRQQAEVDAMREAFTDSTIAGPTAPGTH